MARKRGKFWQADVRLPDGQRKRASFATQAEAEAFEATTRLDVQLGRPLPASTVAPGSRMASRLETMGALFEHVRDTVWQHQKAAASSILNGRDVMRYFGSERLVSTITRADTDQMRSYFVSMGLSPATVNRKAGALSKMLREAQEAGVIARAPRVRRTKEAQSRFRYLDRSEEKVLLAYWKAKAQGDMHDLTLFLLDSGARIFSEAVPARWDAFAPDFATVTLWETKTDVPRTVPLTARTRTMLKRRKKALPDSKGPFVHIERGRVYRSWEHMRLDVPPFVDVTPHTLRHTCCTRLVLGGVDIKRVMSWMGHSSITTTMRYMQIRPQALEEVLHVLEEKVAG